MSIDEKAKKEEALCLFEQRYQLKEKSN